MSLCATRALGTLAGQGSGSAATARLVIVRHGQSTWNKANRFIGWTDTELTADGEVEARVAGRVLMDYGVGFDEVHTSFLKRSIKTAWLMLEEMDMMHTPVQTDWRLNERSYGALVGLDKKECVAEHGEEQVKLWRRGFAVRPPPMTPDHPYYPGRDPRYRDILHRIPLSESLQDTAVRSGEYFETVIAPRLAEGRTVLLVGHENNLRSIIKRIDGIGDDAIREIELPRAVPLIYDFDGDLRPIRSTNAAPGMSARYLGDAAEIKAVQERDLRQVYDTAVTENLEEQAQGPRFGQRYRDDEQEGGGPPIDDAVGLEGLPGQRKTARGAAGPMDAAPATHAAAARRYLHSPLRAPSEGYPGL